ncbi:MCP four helix bundle domain-containing protein [Winogradskyella schleiferi]|uniref:MCP four helix bundle domain-containing protein n=1 Tax=Winogradskyella schleiferi TaxID=2686078 RepID=UPI0015BF7D07|nr:MCP four helix bundle domain-containing protein [Winogradskyella schleiferi]
MSKKKTISSQLNIVLVLLAVFLLIYGTNRIDKRHFETAQNAINSVYKDRVLAQDYIYKMNNLIHKKQSQLIEDSRAINLSTNKDIETLIALFSETELTRNELNTFNSFRTGFEKLKSKEARFNKKIKAQLNNEHTDKVNDKNPFEEDLAALQKDLDNLALIQVSESKSVMTIAQKSLNSNQLLSTMEIYALLVVGIIILAVTFYRIEKH